MSRYKCPYCGGYVSGDDAVLVRVNGKDRHAHQTCKSEQLVADLMFMPSTAQEPQEEKPKPKPQPKPKPKATPRPSESKRQHGTTQTDVIRLVRSIYGDDMNESLVRAQLRKMSKSYSYDDIAYALHYFYRIQGNATQGSNGGIGIVEYCIDDAMRYRRHMQEVNERNAKAAKSEEVHAYSVTPKPVRIPALDRLGFFRLR